jgi:NAD+ synthase
MTDNVTIALAQINPVVGALADNAALAIAWRAKAAALGADLIVFPEQSLLGYPAEDLTCKPFVLDHLERIVGDLAELTGDGGPAMLIGTPWRQRGGLYNAVLLLDGGAVAAVRLKRNLPNYGPFDEKRIFDADRGTAGPINFRGMRLGVMICEDVWTAEAAETLAETGAELLVIANASPFERDKADQRMAVAVARIVETGLPLIYVNAIGGQDELVFDGGSFVLNADASLALQLPCFEEGLALSRWRRETDGWKAAIGDRPPPLERLPRLYAALVTGLRDYVEKNGFPGVLLGLSGGLDSALAAAIAVDALGPERVQAVMMPSPYTSEESLEDASASAALLGCRLECVRIEPAMEAFAAMLSPLTAGTAPDVTEENIQSRSRGMLLMALSNKFGKMTLSTGNKSEMAVGYATLYGDMCGGFAVLKDVYKTLAYELARWRNGARLAWLKGPDGPVMPERTLTKAPTAELRPNQKDQDSLPDYPTLDAILEGLIEQDLSLPDLVAQGYDAAMVNRVWRMLDRAEYKRRQAPPGVKMTTRCFGKDRRYPITSGLASLFLLDPAVKHG